jgi:DNA-binding protein YbaB
VGRDFISSLIELTHRIEREQAALQHAMARGQQVCTGTDESGTITVHIDDEGTARDVQVAADWRYRLTPAQVGPAVVAADTAAAQRRESATAEALAEQSTADNRESTGDGLGGDRGAGGFGGPPVSPEWFGALTAPPGHAAPATPSDLSGQREPASGRSLAEISAAVLAAVDDLDRITEPPPPVHGIGAEGAVRVTLAGSRITECTINQAWLVRQDEVTLAHALREAVSRAAAAGLAARTPLLDFQRRLDGLVADAQANLAHLARGGRP